MIQTKATYEVTDGVLMADNDQIISIHNGRVDIYPLLPVPAQAPPTSKREHSIGERIAELACKTFVIVAALYLAGQVLHACSSGAFTAVH